MSVTKEDLVELLNTLREALKADTDSLNTSLSEKIDSLKADVNSLKKQFDEAEIKYDRKIRDVENTLGDFRVSTVDFTNSAGFRPAVSRRVYRGAALIERPEDRDVQNLVF